MKKPPKIVMDILRAAIGIGIAAVLIYSVIKQNDVDLPKELGASAKGYLLIALALYGVALTLTALRWKTLLHVQGVDLTLGTAWRLTMIGVFFSLVLPGGAVGGDVLKMVYIANRAKDRKSEAILTIMLDRVFGLLGLMIMAVLGMVICLDFLRGALGSESGQVIFAGTIFVGVCSVGGIVATLAASFHNRLERLPGVSHLIELGGRKLPGKVTEIVLRLVRGFDLYKQRRDVLAKVLGISLLVHLTLATCVFALGRAFHESQVAPRQYFLAVQVANTVSGIPGFPGGMGARDKVMSVFLLQAGADKEKAGTVPVVFSIVLSLWSLLGGVCFAATRMSGDPVEQAALHELAEKELEPET